MAFFNKMCIKGNACRLDFFMLFFNRSERETSPFFMRSQRTNELLLRKRVSAFDSRRRIIEQANDNASGSEPCEIPTDGIKRQSAFNEQSAGIRMLSTSTARMTWRACANTGLWQRGNL